MTTETSNARGEWVLVPSQMTLDMEIAFCETWFSKRRAIDDAEMADAYTAMLAAAPPPAAARGDVRGLVARVAQLREAIESEPDHCFGANVIGGRAYGVRENLLCIVGLIEAALAAEGVQAGEDAHPDDAAVDAFAASLKTKLAFARAKGRGGWDDDEPGMQQRLSDMLRSHVEKGDPRDVANFCMFLHQRGESILSQQPEARGVVDGDEVFRLAAGSHYGAEPNSYWDMDRDALLAFARALTGERNG